ncbi:hypothetical protein scyTo_0026706, partial [Scyliorhinus torazame]|nr:hypothetical protein [Scyliorhinus torazame]
MRSGLYSTFTIQSLRNASKAEGDDGEGTEEEDEEEVEEEELEEAAGVRSQGSQVLVLLGPPAEGLAPEESAEGETGAEGGVQSSQVVVLLEPPPSGPQEDEEEEETTR